MRARLRDEHRRAARDRVVPARRDERAVGAAPARLRQRRAAEQRDGVLAERAPTRARPALRRRTRGRRRCSGRPRAAAAPPTRDRRTRRTAIRDAREMLLRRLGAAHLHAGRRVRRSSSVSTIPIASGVGSSSTRPSASRRSVRSAGVACVPTSHVQARATSGAQDLVQLGAHLLDLVGVQAKALRDVPAGLVAAPHPQHVAVVRDPLVGRAERRVGVRVLRELDQQRRRSSVPELLRPRLAVDRLQMLDARDVGARLRRTGSAGPSRATCRRCPARRCRRRARAARCRTSGTGCAGTTRRSGC